MMVVMAPFLLYVSVNSKRYYLPPPGNPGAFDQNFCPGAGIRLGKGI